MFGCIFFGSERHVGAMACLFRALDLLSHLTVAWAESFL